jgi:hypothetical protein
MGIWGKLLEGHPDAEAFIKAVQCMSTMVSEAMHQTPDVDRLKRVPQNDDHYPSKVDAAHL